MGWAVLRHDGIVFMVRVGGVAVSGGRVLLHRAAGDDFWALPGGRLQVGETASEALRREMREEIDAEVEVGGLLWVIENFFTHAPLDQHDLSQSPLAHHEVGLYLEMTVPERLAGRPFAGVEAEGTEHEFTLEFSWFPRDEVAGMDVRPAALRERLTQPLPAGVASIVQRG